MADTVLETFQTLRKNKTFIRLRIPDNDFERIVIVADVRPTGQRPLVAIDCPAEMADVMGAIDRTELIFEFTGEDQLRYRFATTNGFISDNTIWIEIPDKIERNQRRSDFRLTAPLGALFYFTAGAERKRVKMMDLSAGGTSGILISIKNGIQQTPPVKIDQIFLNLKLVFAGKGDQITIPIRECVVRRIENLPQTGRYLMAVAFTRMDEAHRTQLNTIIYNEQRYMLKIRQQRQ